MKKHIPTTLLQQSSHPTFNNDESPSSTSNFFYKEKQTEHKQASVEIPDLIKTIAQRNIEAMSPSRNQKRHNKAALRSVLHSIFSS